MVKLGNKVKDPVTGISGIAFCRVSYLQGCDRIGVQMPTYKDDEGKTVVPDLYHVDEPQLTILKGGVKPAKSTTGGPSFFGPSGKER